MSLFPDPTTSYIDPFRAAKTLVVNFFIHDPLTGEAYWRNPRNIARKAQACLASTASITTAGPAAAELVRVRMPKFPLADDEQAALARLFRRDGPDSRAAAACPRRHWPRRRNRRRRHGLVTADGFGCTSCHAIGRWAAAKGRAVNARRREPAQASATRVRREWFDRWVRNPARIVPQMEMPSIVQAGPRRAR